MIRFLWKGILRDRSRSFLPIIIISIGVALTVLLSAYMQGAMTDMVDQNARFETGHMKVMTKAFAANQSQLPNDLALLEVSDLLQQLEKDFPMVDWVKRIRFGGLIDVPDQEGNTRGQGPAIGMAFDLLNPQSEEVKRLQIEKSIVSGHLPKTVKEALVGHDFAEKLNLKIGEEITYFGTTMNGSMTFQNFKISGTIRFGAAALDRGAMVVDIQAAQKMLDMQDGAGELLGFLKTGVYHHDQAEKISQAFNDKYKNDPDEFAPEMYPLKAQNNLADLLDYADMMAGILVFIFVLAMSVVLWNTGLLGGLRRYKEFGIRLALGESKPHIYWMLILEAVIIGFIGSIFGTIIGLAGAYYMQIYGIDISDYTKNSTMLMPSVIRAKITPIIFFIGFIPGVLAMVLGTMLSGIGIYKRETARLFNELI